MGIEFLIVVPPTVVTTGMGAPAQGSFLTVLGLAGLTMRLVLMTVVMKSETEEKINDLQ